MLVLRLLLYSRVNTTINTTEKLEVKSKRIYISLHRTNIMRVLNMWGTVG